MLRVAMSLPVVVGHEPEHLPDLLRQTAIGVDHTEGGEENLVQQVEEALIDHLNDARASVRLDGTRSWVGEWMESDDDAYIATT